jgi:hypothetical protein
MKRRFKIARSGNSSMVESPLRFDCRILSRTLAALMLATAAICGGCQSAHVADSVTAKYSSDDSQLDFWHELADRPLASNDDVFHALLLFQDGTDKSANYADRVQTLKSRGLLPNNFSEPADLAIERGTLAVAIVKVLDMKGGWVMHVFGSSPRYAVKELVYADVFPPSSPQQTFSGSEVVGIFGKVEDVQRANSAHTP